MINLIFGLKNVILLNYKKLKFFIITQVYITILYTQLHFQNV